VYGPDVSFSFFCFLVDTLRHFRLLCTTMTRSIKVSERAWAELVKRKEETGVPVVRQVEGLLWPSGADVEKKTDRVVRGREVVKGVPS
jgi:hypothetical protein